MISIYTRTAKEIIQNSIRSAIFIDDNLAVPFKANQKAADMEVSRALYNSFVKNNVSIDFYKYSSSKDWRPQKDFMFKGRDLLVLDWQLDNDSTEKNTLEILDNAVKTQSLHFVCIYTSSPKRHFPNIAYAIKAYFSHYDNNRIEDKTIEIEAFLDSGLEKGFTSEIKNQIKAFLVEYSLNNQSNKQEKFEKLKADIISLIGEDQLNALQKEIGKVFKSRVDAAFEAFGYGLNEELCRRPDIKPVQISCFIEEHFLVIDNTIVLITNKTKPTPSSVYNYFTEALLRSAGNFLTLLSLDLRNMLKDSSGFVGKELDTIDETAFFYHKDHVQPKEAFFEFVLELWKSNLTSLLYSQNHLIKLFDEEILKKYRKAKKIDSRLKAFKRKGNKTIDSDLAKLNYYYNSVEVRNLNDVLRFGDVFNVIDDKGQKTKEFFLCITAHCDCLHVENIKQNFHFVRGMVIDNLEGLKEGDSGFNSFLMDEAFTVFCVRWIAKPFTVFIEDNKLLKGIHEIGYGKGQKKIVYAGTIKENYAQRISNNAFSHPMRVGIFFAKKE